MKSFKAIMDIPDASLLVTSKLSDLVDLWSRKTGVDKPDVICLPLFDEGGSQFPLYNIRANRLWSSFSLTTTMDEIKANYPSTKIYLCIMPQLPGITAGHLARRTQFGRDGNDACITNPAVQQTLKKFLFDAIDKYNPDGIVFDNVNIQGQSGREGFVEVTCFCHHCKKQLIENQKFLHVDEISRLRSPFDVVLLSKKSSVQFVTPKSRMSAEELVDLAEASGVITERKSDHLEAAQVILEYIRARSGVTGSALGVLNKYIKEKNANIRTCVILPDSNFDWTAGTGLEGVVNQVDEVWLDIDDLQYGEVPPNIDIFFYAANRTRYYIDAFFAVTSDYEYIRNTIGTSSVKALLKQIEQKRDSALRVQTLDPLTILSAQSLDYLSGMVGAVIDNTTLSRVESGLRPEIAEIVQREFTSQETANFISKSELMNYIQHLVLSAISSGGEIPYSQILQIAAQTGVAETSDLQKLLDELRN